MTYYNLGTEEEYMKNYEQAYINFEKSINFLKDNLPENKLIPHFHENFIKFKEVI